MTLLTGTLRDAGGNLVNGYMHLELSGNAIVQSGPSSPCYLAPGIPIIFTITNGVITAPSPAQVFGLDVLLPASGLYYKQSVFNTDNGNVMRRNISITGSTEDLGGVSPIPPGPGPAVGTELFGDVTGLTTDTHVVRLQGRSMNASDPNLNDVLAWDGIQWSPSAGGGSTIFASPFILYGNGTNIPASSNLQVITNGLKLGIDSNSADLYFIEAPGGRDGIDTDQPGSPVSVRGGAVHGKRDGREPAAAGHEARAEREHPEHLFDGREPDG